MKGLQAMADQDTTPADDVIPGKGMRFAHFFAIKFPDTNHELTGDLHAIAAALKAGEEVPGARLRQGKRLVIK